MLPLSDLYQLGSVFLISAGVAALIGWRFEQKIVGRFWKRAR